MSPRFHGEMFVWAMRLFCSRKITAGNRFLTEPLVLHVKSGKPVIRRFVSRLLTRQNNADCSMRFDLPNNFLDRDVRNSGIISDVPQNRGDAFS